jgi:hypothetical protein
MPALRSAVEQVPGVFGTLQSVNRRAKNCTLNNKTAKLMVFKLVNAAVKTWRRLNGENQLPFCCRNQRRLPWCLSLRAAFGLPPFA